MEALLKHFPRRLLLPALAAFVAAPLALASPEPPALRLPGDVVPRKGAVELTIRPADPKFTGTAAFEVDVKKPVDLVWVNANGLEISSASLTSGGKERSAKVVPGGTEFAGLSFEAPVGAGPAVLRLAFSGTAADKDTRGLFRQKEGESWYVFSQFEAVDARRAFPCFDEPSYKHPWKLTLHVPRGDLAFSNTPQTGEKAEADGMKAVSFAETKPLPSYLVALAVGPFDVVDAGSVGKTKLRVIAPKGQGAQARYAQETIAPLLTILQDYFGIPYPYEKLDSVAIPTTVGFGAMENPGLITYASNIILARPQDEGIRFRRGFASVAAHEMAHQWFGDLVTMAFWDDTWLNESFASWMGDKAVDRWKPEWEGLTDRVSTRNRAMGADSLVTARKIHQPIVTKDDIANAFDGITYGKGQSVLSMFESWMGEEAFRKGIRRHLTAHAYGNATASDFLSALGAEGHPEVPAAFSTFLDQAGVPVLSVSLSCADGQPAKLALAQKRLLPVGSTSAAPETWQIPVCVRYGAASGEARECSMISGASAEMVLTKAKGCPAWLLANEGASGYYRPSYAGDLLKKLVAAAPQHLSPGEKVALLSDARALSTAGELSVGDTLGLVPAFAKEENRAIVTTLAGLVEGVKERGLPAEELPAFGRFVEKTFGARARAMGLTPKPGEGDDARLLRGTLVGLVAVEGKDPSLRAEAVALAKKWLSDRKAIDADLQGVVLHIAADAGDAELFDGYVAAAKAEKNRRERQRLLGQLGSFTDPKLLERALDVAVKSDFDARETTGIFFSALGDERTREQAFAYVKAHWDEIVARLPEAMRGYLPYLGASFCDDAHRSEVESFFTPRVKGFEGAPRNLAQALEGIKVCTAVRTAQAAGLKEFLDRF